MSNSVYLSGCRSGLNNDKQYSDKLSPYESRPNSDVVKQMWKSGYLFGYKYKEFPYPFNSEYPKIVNRPKIKLDKITGEIKNA